MTLLNQLETAAHAATKFQNVGIIDFPRLANPANILKLISEYRKAVDVLKKSKADMLALKFPKHIKTIENYEHCETCGHKAKSEDEYLAACIKNIDEAIQAYTVLEGK